MSTSSAKILKASYRRDYSSEVRTDNFKTIQYVLKTKKTVIFQLFNSILFLFTLSRRTKNETSDSVYSFPEYP